MQRGLVVAFMVALQLLLLVAGFSLSMQWILGLLPWHGWWANLPMVAILLCSLLAFSYEEARFGLALSRRKKSDPEALGGWLEGVAFFTWLVLLVNMVATVFKGIRALKALI